MRQLLAWLSERHRGYVLLLVAAVLGLYLPWVGNPFFFDDIPFFSGIAAPEPWLSVLQRPRGLPYNTLQYTWFWFGNGLSHAYHLFDAVLHASNVVALFYLLNTLLTLQLPERKRSDLNWASMVASLVFALNPVATYAAGYVIQRSVLMAVLFGLLATLAWAKAWTSGRAGLAVVSLLLYFLSCFSKEHAVALPALLAATSLMLARERKLAWPALAACAALAMGIAVFLMLRRFDVVGVSYEPMSAHLFTQSGVQATGWRLHLLSIATQAGLFFRYLLLWLFPLPAWMAIDMRVEFLAALNDWRVPAALLAYAACGACALRWLLRRGASGLIGLALLAPWLMFAVEFATVRVQETFVLYRSYLWAPLLMLLPAVLALRLQDFIKQRQRLAARVLLPLMLIILLAPAATNRLAVAADPWTLWNDAARLLENDAVPGADRILYNRALAAMAAGQTANAVADMERVARISPGIWQVWQVLAAARLAHGQSQQAYQDFTRALQLRPGEGALLYGRAIALRRSGQEQAALADIQASCQAGWATACLIVARMAPVPKPASRQEAENRPLPR